MHALNNVLGRAVFTPEALVDASHQYSAARPDLAAAENPDHSRGWYSSEILAQALSMTHVVTGEATAYELLLTDARADPSVMNRTDVVGALLYMPNHWLCIRKERESFWLLDSLSARPRYLLWEAMVVHLRHFTAALPVRRFAAIAATLDPLPPAA